MILLCTTPERLQRGSLLSAQGSADEEVENIRWRTWAPVLALLLLAL